MRISTAVLFLVALGGMFAAIQADVVAPDPTDYVLLSYKLSAADEDSFYTSLANGSVEAPFWKKWTPCGLDYIYEVPSTSTGGASVFTSEQDAQLTVYSAYGDSGVYFYFKVMDDDWVSYNSLSDPAGWVNQWSNDAIDFYLDVNPSAVILATPQLRFLTDTSDHSGSASGMTKTTEQYFFRFGGADNPSGACLNTLYPLWNGTTLSKDPSGGDPTTGAFNIACYTFPDLKAQTGIQCEAINTNASNIRIQQWIIPWDQIGHPGLGQMPSVGTMIAAVFGYNDVDDGQPGVNELRWKHGDPTGMLTSWCDMQFGPELATATAGCNVPVIRKAGLLNTVQTKIVKSEYYSLTGKRIDVKNGLAGLNKNEIMINRTTDANGVVRTLLITK